MNPNEREFHDRAERVAPDLEHRGRMTRQLKVYAAQRSARETAYGDFCAARSAATSTKWQALASLDRHLIEFSDRLEARGTKVHWAETGEQGREIILGILEARGAKLVVKSKAMTAEEIGLAEALSENGLEVVESDLGEFIVQLRKEPPYHIVFPAMHLTRGEVGELFHDELAADRTDDPEALTMIARRVLRRKYVAADAGITGANFAVAETGMISITENEGNARLGAALPSCMITLVGIEKVLPKLEDLALFLPLLATAGAAQLLTCYNTLYAGPRARDESDGPEEYHVVLLDNGRSELLADPELRDALRCIRCGACLNVCPVFRNVGGHTYGTTYPGPIGAVLTPSLRKPDGFEHLPEASSLCGACSETCPVGIDLHHHLLEHRRRHASERPSPLYRTLFRGFAFVCTRPALYSASVRALRLGARFLSWLAGLGVAKAVRLRVERVLPTPARVTFRERWRRRS
jgi:L-lactate dehydrogenase complex protein LldF